MAEEGADQQPNFTQEETDIPVLQVQDNNPLIYDTIKMPPWGNDFKLAWKDVAN